MKRDIRLYTYQSGRLKVLGGKRNGFHKFTSVSQCLNAVWVLSHPPLNKKVQYVVVEYTSSYESRIIYVSPIDIASVL